MTAAGGTGTIVCRWISWAAYENLKEDLTTALARVGIEFDGWLPRAKGGNRDPESRPYQRFLSDEAREKITLTFTPEIELLGYRFEEKGKATAAHAGGTGGVAGLSDSPALVRTMSGSRSS